MSESVTGSQPVFLIREHNAAASVADFLTDAPMLYEKVFCARGNSENLMKDMKRWTRSDKTACSRWQANQFRLFLHMGAYWLLHALRRAAPKRSRWRGATSRPSGARS